MKARKKFIRPNYTRKYNKLFKFLNFDFRFSTCIFLTTIILLYFLLIMGIYAMARIEPHAPQA
jgi:hypothetical protein